jgi:hypothetical protein
VCPHRAAREVAHATHIVESLAGFLREVDDADVETLVLALEYLKSFDDDVAFVPAPRRYPVAYRRAEVFYATRGYLRNLLRVAEQQACENGG